MRTKRTPTRLLLLSLVATALAVSLLLGDAREAPAAHEVETIVDISAGGAHTCLVTDSGVVQCWGSRGEKVLGRELLHSSSNRVPGDVEGLQGVATNVTVGHLHSCVRFDDGTANCWGSSPTFLGAGPTDTAEPQSVVGIGSEVTSISAGLWHSCVSTVDQNVWCWGYDGKGNLGFECGVQQCPTPMEAAAVHGDAVSVVSGYIYTCVITSTATVKCWGRNSVGNLGDGTEIDSATPVDVVGIDEDVVSIDAWLHTCAVTGSGALMCWGYNDEGQVGTGATGDEQPFISTPTEVSGLGEGVSAVSTGAHHTCALTTLGGVKCWGSNQSGQLGNGTWINSSVPVDVLGLQSGVSMIDAGDYHTCALVYGEVKCWGAKYSYGSSIYPLPPVPLPDDEDHDFVPDNVDNCPGLANPEQLDNEPDWLGDACDDDDDNDGLLDIEELVLGTDPKNADTDGDGCSDGRELGDDVTLGGLRDPLNPWDFYDVAGPDGGPKDGVVDLFNDIVGVLEHLNAYDVRFDRGPALGPEPWKMTAPDGNIDLFNDLTGVVAQYGHNCR